MTRHNEEIKPLLDKVEKIEKLTLKRFGIELPKVVIIGDQSSGKSSVIESVSGVSLPRGNSLKVESTL